MSSEVAAAGLGDNFGIYISEYIGYIQGGMAIDYKIDF